MRPPRVKRMRRKLGLDLGITEFPNFSVTGSIVGMRNQFYGDKALLVRCGAWIYNVPEDIYGKAI